MVQDILFSFLIQNQKQINLFSQQVGLFLRIMVLLCCFNFLLVLQNPMLLFLEFIATFFSGLIAVAGGNGLVLMPTLLMLDLDIKEIMVLTRVSAVVFVVFNLLAVIKKPKFPDFSRHDLVITFLSCVTIILSISLLSKLDNNWLMSFISLVLIALALLVICKPSGPIIDKVFLVILPVFAGICGSVIGGAGLIISILYTLMGMHPHQVVQKKIIPSLIIQLVSFTALMNQGIHANQSELLIVIIASAFAGYFNMKLFLKLSPQKSKILFYASLIFSIFNLMEDVIENMLKLHGMDWRDLLPF